MNTLFKKVLKVATFATFVAVWLTACSRMDEIPAPPKPKPEHHYMGKFVFTEKTYDWKIEEAAWTFHCTPSGVLMEILYYGGYRGALSANVLDRSTGKPVFCDPATGKVFESK